MSWQEVSGPDHAAAGWASPQDTLTWGADALVSTVACHDLRPSRHSARHGRREQWPKPGSLPGHGSTHRFLEGNRAKFDSDQTLSIISETIISCLTSWVGETRSQAFTGYCAGADGRDTSQLIGTPARREEAHTLIWAWHPLVPPDLARRLFTPRRAFSCPGVGKRAFSGWEIRRFPVRFPQGKRCRSGPQSGSMSPTARAAWKACSKAAKRSSAIAARRPAISSW
jgi:hypothetical protein